MEANVAEMPASIRQTLRIIDIYVLQEIFLHV